MEFLQYFLQVLGATMIITGYLSSQVNNRFLSQHSFWSSLNEVTALKETHEYIMHKGANIINGLIFVSGFILLVVLCYGISFVDLLLANIANLESNLNIKDAIEGSQFITFIVLLGLSSAISIALIEDNRRHLNNNNNISQKLFFVISILLAFTCLYIIFTKNFPALLDLDEVINPVFKEKFSSFTSGIIIPFSSTTLMLIYPILVILGLISVAIASSSEFTNHSENESIKKQIITFINNSLIFIVGFVGSMFYTLISGALGTSYGDTVIYDISFRLVTVNALFDGITLYATAKILIWASAAWRCRIAISSIERGVLKVKSDMESYLSHHKHLNIGDEEYSRIKHISSIKKKLENFKKNYENLNLKELKESFYNPLPSEGYYSSPLTADIFTEISSLSIIMGNKSSVAFDRALCRTVLDDDQDITLINALTNSTEKDINPNQSWYFQIIEKVIEQLESDLVCTTEPVPKNGKINDFLSKTWNKIDISREKLKGRAKIALFSDCLLAAVFSFLSIYISLYGTNLHMSISQLWSLFIGGFDGASFTNLGPLFWVMHTTFVPSIVLWFLVLSVLFFSNIINPLINFLFSLKKEDNSNFMNEVRVSFAKTGSVLSAIGTLIAVFR